MIIKKLKNIVKNFLKNLSYSLHIKNTEISLKNI